MTENKRGAGGAERRSLKLETLTGGRAQERGFYRSNASKDDP